MNKGEETTMLRLKDGEEMVVQVKVKVLISLIIIIIII